MTAALRIAILKSRRVAFDMDGVSDGGSMHVLQQVESLRHAGHEVDIFTRADFEHDPSLIMLKNGARLWLVSCASSTASNVFERDLFEGESYVRGVLASPGFAAAAFDVLHIHHWTSGAGLFDHLPIEIPIVFTPHLLPSEKAIANGLKLPAAVADLERRLVMRANVTIAASFVEMTSCMKLGARRVELLSNGVCSEFFTAQRRVKPIIGSRLRLGSVGRICQQKGTDILLDAMEILISAGLDVQLDIVGPSYSEEEFEATIRARLERVPLAGHVCLLGQISPPKLPSVMTNWDIYLQPSRYESQGIALLEAMAGARLVIATELPAVAEYLNNQAGLLISSPPDGASVAAAVLHALQSTNWEGMQLAARKAARRFDWPTAVSILQSILSDVVDSSPWRGARSDPALSRVLRKRANGVALDLAEVHHPEAILLLGSGARGLARAGSDIDILMLQSSAVASQQIWHFTDGNPVDVRIVPKSRIEELCDLSDAEFASISIEDPLPDYLCGAEPLGTLRVPLAAAIARVQTRRCEAAVIARISDGLRKRAADLFAEAIDAACRNASIDGQLKLNAGSQALLQAAMVREGWITQGAKRRPEAAVTYARHSQPVRDASVLLARAVGIDKLTVPHGFRLVAARTKLRAEHVKCLEVLGAAGVELDDARRHASGSTDYYTPAISNGYLKGCINHIRSFSGVPRLPLTYARVLDWKSEFPGQEFISSREVCGEVKDLWIEILAPQSRDVVVETAESGLELTL